MLKPETGVICVECNSLSGSNPSLSESTVCRVRTWTQQPGTHGARLLSHARTQNPESMTLRHRNANGIGT
jgi:hypothetical protein